MLGSFRLNLLLVDELFVVFLPDGLPSLDCCLFLGAIFFAKIITIDLNKWRNHLFIQKLWIHKRKYKFLPSFLCPWGSKRLEWLSWRCSCPARRRLPEKFGNCRQTKLRNYFLEIFECFFGIALIFSIKKYWEYTLQSKILFR